MIFLCKKIGKKIHRILYNLFGRCFQTKMPPETGGIEDINKLFQIC